MPTTKYKEPLLDSNKKIRKRPLTREEKEYIAQHIEDKIEFGKQTLNPLLSSEIEEFSEEEIRQQKKNLESIIPTCKHEEITKDTDGTIVCRYCGIKIIKSKGAKEKIIDLFCIHKELEVFDNIYDICIKCGAKFKK